MAKDAVAGYLSVLEENKHEIPVEKSGVTVSEVLVEVPMKKLKTI